MPVLKQVLGLDLGAHSLKAVEFRQTLRGIEAGQLRSLPRTDPDAPVSELVRGFTTLHRMNTDHVVAALPGDNLSMHQLSFPFSERRKLTQAVPFAIEEDVPFQLEDVVVGWEVTRRERGRAEVQAVIAPRSEVSSRIELLEEAGCTPRILEAEGLVLGNLAAVFDLPGRRLLVDLGHRKTSLCLLVDGATVAARTIALGGHDLTEALAGDRGLSMEEAERAKCEEGVFGADLGELPPQTAKVLDRLAREILRALGAWEDRLGGVKPDELTLFGGTALLDRIDLFLAERTGVPTARLGLPREGQGDALVAGGPPILYAPAIALALRGTARGRGGLNFRQDEFALRVDVAGMLREFRTTGLLAAGAAILGIVTFGVTTVLQAHRANTLEAAIARLYGEALPGRPLPINPAGTLRAEVQSAQERADFLGVYRGNLSALDLLTEISRLVPRDLDIGLEELAIDRQTVRMRVQAKSFEAADRLGTELARFAPFANARIGAIETDSKTGSKRFNVTIALNAREGRE